MRRRAFALAGRLGMTVAELGRRMTAAEFLEWEAFDSIHLDDSWYQAAQSCLVNSRIAGSTRATIEDFLPDRNRLAPSGPTSPQLAAKLKKVAEDFNAKLAGRAGGVVFGPP